MSALTFYCTHRSPLVQVAELEAEAWEEYNQKMEEYKQKWNEWKRESKVKKNSDQEPEPPLKPDLQNLQSDVSKMVSDCIRPPDEPPIVLQLTEDTPTNDVTDTAEQQRRSLVKRCQIAFRILYNGQEVCQTLPQSLDQSFKVTFNQLFAIRILHWPQTLSVELIMDGRRNVAEIFIPIPSSGVTLDSAPVEQLVFSSCSVVRGVNGVGAVGAGVEFSIVPGGAPLCPYTEGVVICRTGWAQENGVVLCPPDKYLPAAVRSRNKVAPALSLIKDISKLKDWADKTQLDPNDPSNAEFFESLKAASHEVTLVKEPLLNPLVAQFEFCTDEELEKNPRLKLLRLRDQATPEFRGVRCIPLREREIPPDIFKIYEKRLSTASSPLKQGESVTGLGGGGSIETHRAYGVVFLAKVKDNLVRRFRQARHQRALRDIVIEDQVPDMGTLGLTFMKWLQPKRPLRPRRKERTKVPVKSLAGHEVKIIVNVVRAFEVPVRADVDPGPGAENGARGGGIGGSGAALVPVRPFVEISFQGQRCRTTTAEGANPTWNQDLHIPLKAPNGDMTPGGLQSIRDNLYCHLYDETVVDLLEDDRQRTTNIHQRMERHWLGSLAIPFASLYANSRVEGTFKLYSPPVVLGYERGDSHSHAPRHVTSSATPAHPTPSHLRNNTFLTLFITVHPPLHLPEPFKERLECSEPPHLEQYMEEWEAQVKRDFPDRSVKSTVMDVNGKSVCVTRFFRPLEPPVLEEGVVTSPEMAAWFVSKIPSTPGSILFPGLFDIWLTADQVLKVLQGDSDDLAILLCCFFLRLGLRAWLVLGVGIPHGRSSFVLTQRGGGVEGESGGDQWHVWDPTTGQKFALTDSFCPLHRVHCLINDENVWMNVQREDLLRRVRLDVGRRGDWCGMFARGAAAAAAAASLQPTQLEFAPTSAADAQVLQDRIEKLLRDSIAKWRPTARTVWNRYCIVTLRKLLPSLEKASWSNEQTSTILQEHLQELNHILASHKMCGFPLNFAYTKIEDIEEAVKGTGVHCYESLDVEFALAVYVHPYPCDILSVWVYVASLVRRR
ncbi:coiled-coil and C2 domain-containing protein 2A-like isoform X2 [Nilaparvata lugens]|uniref:coiled-coil and C2 domain-containing protein 2A-like isoform X2 n=1 Tax=Nilaparvata lugens TaxID=108931 RepID=UPI00193D8271|nr:coiled-coil and C2 domain-containing protein 2A-like isoform X2 [Nilaparvata lugens]